MQPTTQTAIAQLGRDAEVLAEYDLADLIQALIELHGAAAFQSAAIMAQLYGTADR